MMFVGGVRMIKILTRCPVCEGYLKAVKLKCDSCSTVIENSFDFPPLMKLSKDHMDFAEVFLRCRGNIKDVEKELGISYPTVRAKLDQVIEALSDGKPMKKDESAKEVSDRLQAEVLQQLEEGLITPEEAIAAMENMKKGELR